MPLSEEDVAINEEIADIMRRVRKMAQEHTSNFHCGAGADEAIRAAGLHKYDVDNEIKVSVDFRVEGVSDDIYVTEHDFDKADLVGKDHQAQCDWVAERMSPTLVFGDSNFEVDVKVVVTDLNKVIPPEPRLPRGFAFHVVHNGRSAHVLPPSSRDPLCGQVYTGFNPLRDNATLGTPVCKRCRKRALSAYDMDTGDVV